MDNRNNMRQPQSGAASYGMGRAQPSARQYPPDAAARRAEAERRRQHDLMMKKRAKVRRKQRLIVCLFLTTTMMTIVFSATVFIWWKVFSSAPDADPKKSVIYRYGGESDTEIISRDKAVMSGTLYVNFTRAAKYLGVSSVGNSDKVKYVIKDGTGNDEYAVFEPGSETAYINGRYVRLTEKAVMRGDNLWVPASFITDHMNGVNLAYTADDGIALISRTVVSGTAGDGTQYSVLSFAEKPTEAPAVVPEGGATDAPVFKPTFTADLDAYEQYMNPADAKEYLVLANKTTMLDASYQPGDLVSITDTRKDGRETQQMRYTAAKALEALFIEMRAEGMEDYSQAIGQPVSVMSGFRSYSYQKYLFDYYLSAEKEANPTLTDEQVKELVLTYSAFPGTSEHQTGLCVDMHNLPSADESYKNQASYAWLRENAWKFGFILRYPEDKVGITGYSFEPWHWRFVGRNAAYVIWQNGLCLEEYLGNLDR